MNGPDSLHLHDSAGNHIGDVCRGTGRHYRVYAHTRGARVYRQYGKPTKSLNVAMKRMGQAVRKGQINRAMVALCADYYDPMKVYEVIKS